MDDFKNFLFSLESRGAVKVENIIDTNILNSINCDLIKNLNNFNLKNIPGSLMGNLNIQSCHIHTILWKELIKSPLIQKLINYNKAYKYVDFGGNVNLSGSKKQRLHVDGWGDNIILNVPLVNVSEFNGPISLIHSNYDDKYDTYDIFAKSIYENEKFILTKLGDVLVRYESIWHRGNCNYSGEARIMLSFTLRKDWPFEDEINNRIEKKTEENKLIKFYGNIYGKGFMGRFVETIDFYFPFFLRPIIHGINILKSIMSRVWSIIPKNYS